MGKETERSVRYGNQRIVYQFERKAVKNINAHLRSDGSLYVSAPYGVPLKYVDEMVLSNAADILDKQNQLRVRMQRRENNQITASLVRVVGNKVYIGEFVLPLRVIASRRTAVALHEGAVIIMQPDIADVNLQKELLLKNLKDIAQYLFSALVEKVYQKMRVYHVPYPEVKVRDMKTRWGSWHMLKYTMTLNLKLIYFPVKIIEYIITHEFCHYFEANHGPRFYAWLTKFMPDWKERKQLLNSLNIKLG